jgi:hypothetical protein
MSFHSKSNVEIKADQKISLQATGDIQLQGQNATLQGQMNTTIKGSSGVAIN